MTDKPISPLRQRMIDDRTARRIKEKVQKDDVRRVRTFAAFLGRSPEVGVSAKSARTAWAQRRGARRRRPARSSALG